MPDKSSFEPDKSSKPVRRTAAAASLLPRRNRCVMDARIDTLGIHGGHGGRIDSWTTT